MGLGHHVTITIPANSQGAYHGGFQRREESLGFVFFKGGQWGLGRTPTQTLLPSADQRKIRLSLTFQQGSNGSGSDSDPDLTTVCRPGARVDIGPTQTSLAERRLQ